MIKKYSIPLIIAVISISLLGLAIIQFIWIKGSIELNRQNFDDKVTNVLNRTKEFLEDNAIYREAAILKDINQVKDKNKSIFRKVDIDPINSFLAPKVGMERFRDRSWRFDPDLAFGNISPAKLEQFLQNQFEGEHIDLQFDHGVFSKEENSYTIVNGNYLVTIGELEGSELVINESLNRTEYKVDLFSDENVESPGQLRVFFPSITSFLISSSLPALLSSLLFTGLILLCFIYTITVIMTQRKVSIMKTDFINNMTHEFKTPIATISLATDSILSPKILSDESKVKRFIDIIKQENKRMLGQVEKVLQIGQLEKKDFQLKLSNVEFNNVVSNAVEHRSLKVIKTNGSIEMDLDKNISTIEGDENHISNLIHNLLDNATKYSKEHPEIMVVTRLHKSAVEVSITDKGIGMTSEEVNRIFDRFYRVTTGNLHDVKGFGLGLSYVKAIVEAHKGKIEVKSKYGEGSTFSVFFPLTSVTKP